MYDSKVYTKSACERCILRGLSPIIYLGDAAIRDSTLRRGNMVIFGYIPSRVQNGHGRCSGISKLPLHTNGEFKHLYAPHSVVRSSRSRLTWHWARLVLIETPRPEDEAKTVRD